jgi:hypothetical protein
VSRQRGDHLEMAQYGHQLQEFMKKKGINPFKVNRESRKEKDIFYAISFLNFCGSFAS